MIISTGKDFRAAARLRLPRFLFDYVKGCSYGEATLKRNVPDLATIELQRRVLHGVSGLSLGTEWFGMKTDMPVALAARGEAGVTQLLDLINQEMRTAMSLTGCRSIAEIDRSILREAALAGPIESEQ